MSSTVLHSAILEQNTSGCSVSGMMQTPFQERVQCQRDQRVCYPPLPEETVGLKDATVKTVFLKDRASLSRSRLVQKLVSGRMPTWQCMFL